MKLLRSRTVEFMAGILVGCVVTTALSPQFLTAAPGRSSGLPHKNARDIAEIRELLADQTELLDGISREGETIVFNREVEFRDSTQAIELLVECVEGEEPCLRVRGGATFESLGRDQFVGVNLSDGNAVVDVRTQGDGETSLPAIQAAYFNEEVGILFPVFARIGPDGFQVLDESGDGPPCSTSLTAVELLVSCGAFGNQPACGTSLTAVELLVSCGAFGNEPACGTSLTAVELLVSCGQQIASVIPDGFLGESLLVDTADITTADIGNLGLSESITVPQVTTDNILVNDTVQTSNIISDTGEFGTVDADVYLGGGPF